MVLIGWFLGAVFLQIRKTLARRRDSYAVYLTWGSLTGVLAIIIHSVLDFNLQNGANGLYVFFLIALAVSASHTRLHGNKAIISQIVPDDEMPHTKGGERMDMIFSPVTVPGRMNIGQVVEAAAVVLAVAATP